jgi:hypothetical protein
MKCIKSIKETKTVKLGTIQRVVDKEADVKVKTGEWKFVPKSEWKEVSRKKTEKVIAVAVDVEEVKKVRRGKNKTN